MYFDVIKYHKTGSYGKLSGRIIEDLLANTRDLDGQDEKRNSLDFALWKKANPEHIMRWPSPWGEGFPGWHIECSAMSSKYLGETFDIHGGGMDLMFPHHECEIAQSNACNHKDPVKYWLHNNMITINGKKMGKSLGNFITLNEFFSGNHALLTKAFSPMTIRFFILQAHYRSTLDFSNEALMAAEKAYIKVINGLRALDELRYQPGDVDQSLVFKIHNARKAAFEGLNDDLNSAVAIAELFNMLKVINSMRNGALSTSSLGKEGFELLQKTYRELVIDIFGLKEENDASGKTFNELMKVIIQNYSNAKLRKDYDQVDNIRKSLKENGILIKDGKNGITWDYED